MAKKTDLTEYLTYGVDERHRRVYFGMPYHAAGNDEFDSGDFSQASVEYAIRAIDRMVADHPKTPIEIHMNSYGGDPIAMMALYDTIQSSSCQFKFFGKGAIMSSATWVMAGCDERYLFPNTIVMVHNGNTSVYGTLTDAEITMDFEKIFQERLEHIYARNSRMPKEFWSEVCKRDLFLTAEEAILLGLADKLIHPKKRGNLRKSREYHLSKPIDKRKMNKFINKLFKRIKISSKLTIEIPEYKPEQKHDNIIVVPISQLNDNNKPIENTKETNDNDNKKKD